MSDTFCSLLSGILLPVIPIDRLGVLILLVCDLFRLRCRGFTN